VAQINNKNIHHPNATSIIVGQQNYSHHSSATSFVIWQNL
jgi:hypothetical protein